MGGELFKLMTGTDMLHVAYKGSTGARNDIIGGHVNMMFDEIPAVGPNVIAGQVRALGTTGAKRAPGFPDVPTVSEAGVPGYEHTGWSGIMVPAGTPKPIVDLLNAEIKKLLAKPETKAIWDKQGAETMYDDARRVRRLSARRPREMDQGREAGRHQAGVSRCLGLIAAARTRRQLPVADTPRKGDRVALLAVIEGLDQRHCDRLEPAQLGRHVRDRRAIARDDRSVRSRPGPNGDAGPAAISSVVFRLAI